MRIISWFSHGVASAVATKLAISSGKEIVVACCEVKEEHEDNERFRKDCEEWFGQEIILLGNDEYDRSIYKVFEKTRFLVGPGGARCTRELKKKVREEFEKPDDVHIFGYTVEEQDRMDRFVDANAQVNVWPILIEKGLSKDDCHAILQRSGIKPPVLYSQGFKNNNCIGCVKASSPAYWMLVKKTYPSMFEKMNSMEKYLGRAVCKIDMLSVSKQYPEIYKSLGSPDHKGGGKVYWRPQLHEIPDDISPSDDSPDVQCGIFCHMAEQEIAA